MRHRWPLPPYDYRDELEDGLEGRHPAAQRPRPAAGCPPVRVGKPGVASVRLARQPAPEARILKVTKNSPICDCYKT